MKKYISLRSIVTMESRIAVDGNGGKCYHDYNVRKYPKEITYRQVMEKLEAGKA